MIIKVKTLVFCVNFMSTETYTYWILNYHQSIMSSQNFLANQNDQNENPFPGAL